MSRPILDPAEAAQARTSRPVAQLLPSARTFGFVPDAVKLLPADAILVAAVRPGAIGRQIERSQTAGGFAPEHARWTHVAVYIGDERVVEAVPWPGVRTNSIHSYLPDRLILVRRDPLLTDAQRYRIAIRAASRLGEKYSLRSLPSMARQATEGFWRSDTTSPIGPGLVCSQLYSDSYIEVTEAMLWKRIPNIWPCHVSATEKLMDVDVPWLGVA